jgi:exoribonuclease-2
MRAMTSNRAPRLRSIDDALSVQPRAEGGWRIGIHIAAPGLGITPGSRLDEIARERMSSVYMPGDKITMLPQRAVGVFSLDAGRIVPALSLYLDVDAECRRIERHHSQVERVTIADNLRHDEIGEHFTETSLTDPSAAANLPQGTALAVLWRLTLASCRERERVRGKPEPRFRTVSGSSASTVRSGCRSRRGVAMRRSIGSSPR